MSTLTHEPLQVPAERPDAEPVLDLEGWLRQVAEAGLHPQSIAAAMEEDGVAPAKARALAAAAVIRHGTQSLATLLDSAQGHDAAAQLRLWFAEAGANDAPAEGTGLLDPDDLQAHQHIAAGRSVQLHLVSRSPRIAVFGNLLADDECDTLIALGRERLQPDRLINPDSASGDSLIDSTFRSSEGCSVDPEDHPLVGQLHDRVDALIGGSRAQRERLVLSRYLPGQEFQPHFDDFAPHSASYAALVREGGQRIATLVIYLNEVHSGGATVFADLGLRISPTRGGATYFTYRRADGSPDRSALHGGAPVLTGEKWIATVWFRERAI